MGLTVVSVDGGAGRLQDEATVLFGFAVVDSGGVELHRFEARYSQLKALHDALHTRGVFELYGVRHSGGVLSSTFPPAYHLKDMKTPENRAIRGAELQSYLSTLLLAHPGIWQQDELLDALNADQMTGITIATAIHQEMGGVSASVEGDGPGEAQRTIPAHFRGRWLHDDRSDDVEPLVAAAGIGWLGHAVGQHRNPPLELFFTDTHLVVVEGDEDPELDGNVTQFLLSGEEELCTRTVKGEEVKVSTKYWSNGEVTKTWTWLWDPRGKKKRCAIVSERQVTGKSVLYAPSFAEHVCFLPLDSPTVPVVTLERHMSRDLQHIPRALPGSLQARAWRPIKHVGTPRAGDSSGGSNGPPPPTGRLEEALAISERTAAASKQLADEARSQRASNLTDSGAHGADVRTAESVALEKLREKDALLAAKRAEAERAEEAEAEKAALLADALKQAAALQEQIQKLTAAAADARDRQQRSEHKPATKQQPGGVTSRGSGVTPSSQQTSRTLTTLHPSYSPTVRITSTPRASGDGKKRRARQPLEMLEHGDLACTTEWWQPGSKGGPDARLEDVLGRAALASGDPKGTLEKLILSSKTKSFKAELEGMGEHELQDKARNLGIALDDDSDHSNLEGLILAKMQEDLLDDLRKLDLQGLKGAAVAAAKENGGDTDEMEAEAAAVAADDDPTGVLASLIVEHANLLQRFKMSGWNLEKLRQRARELGFTDDTISATEAAGESNPDSSPKKALLQLILDGLATNMRLRLKNKELVELLEDAKEESLDLKEIQKALDSDNPKAALLALILQRAKAAEGAQMVEIDSPAVQQGRVPQQQQPLPSRHRRQSRRMAQIKAAIRIQAAWRGCSGRSGGTSYIARESYEEVAALLKRLAGGKQADTAAGEGPSATAGRISAPPSE